MAILVTMSFGSVDLRVRGVLDDCGDVEWAEVQAPRGEWAPRWRPLAKRHHEDAGELIAEAIALQGLALDEERAEERWG